MVGQKPFFHCLARIMNRSLNHYLNLLHDYDPLNEEQHAAIDARVRRDVLARFGGFNVPLTSATSYQLPAASAQESTAQRTGMLVLLRPAFALAGVAAVAVGAVLALQRSGWGPFRVQGIREPVIAPPAEVVAVATPIVPGSGVAVSVFGQASGASTQPAAAGERPTTVRRVRRVGRPINPASSVFDQWGESVFSEEGLLENEREGKNVFNS